PQPGVAVRQSNVESRERAHEHDALDTEVIDAASLAEHLADGREQVGRRQADAGCQDADEYGGGEEVANHLTALLQCSGRVAGTKWTAAKLALPSLSGGCGRAAG